MIYNHKYFKLDTDSRSVYDENGKPLRLTGNSYRVLVFLCSNKNGTVTDIGTFLDWAKDYDENHMRQYRYKINSHIGHDVINYQNGIYSLVGYIKESEIIEGNDRNTDLLQSDNVKSEQVKTNMDKSPEKKPKINIIPAIIAVIVLLLSFIDWSSYGYYTFLKFLVTGVAIYYAYFIYTKLILKGFWFWSLVGIAVLFNPIVPIYLYEKGVWMIIDIMVIIYLIVLVFKFRK